MFVVPFYKFEILFKVWISHHRIFSFFYKIFWNNPFIYIFYFFYFTISIFYFFIYSFQYARRRGDSLSV